MKLIILDRDGVINEDSAEYVRTAQQWRPLPGSLEAIARLSHAGYRVVVATNQAGLARRLFDFDALAAMHGKFLRLLGEFGGRVDGIFFCPHAPEAHCACRKPRPGLLLDIARRYQIELTGIPMVGDSIRDMEAARAAGARPILVRTGNGLRTERENASALTDVKVYDDLTATAEALLSE